MLPEDTPALWRILFSVMDFPLRLCAIPGHGINSSHGSLRGASEMSNNVFQSMTIAMLGICLTAQAGFRHPGVFNSQEELEFIREKVNGSAAHPMKQGLARLQSFYGA